MVSDSPVYRRNATSVTVWIQKRANLCSASLKPRNWLMVRNIPFGSYQPEWKDYLKIFRLEFPKSDLTIYLPSGIFCQMVSTPKFHYKMFSQELIWSGEIYYTNVVVSRLILKMGSEDTLLEKWYISLRLHSVTRQYFFKLEYAQFVARAIKADHEAAGHFVCHRRLSTNHRRRERFLPNDFHSLYGD